MEENLLTALRHEMGCNYELHLLGDYLCPTMDWTNNKYEFMGKTYELRLVEVEQTAAVEETPEMSL